MKILQTICSWLSVIVLAVSVMVLLLLLNVSNFLTEKGMIKTVENINISHEIQKIQNSSPTSENKAEVVDIITMAYDEADKHGISEKLVDEIFNSNETKQFLGKMVGSVTESLITGKSKQTITSEDFNKLLDDNIDSWIKKSNVEISDSKKEVLLIRMKSAGAGVIDNLPNTKALNNKLNEETQNKIQFIFGNTLKFILLAIIIASIGVLIVLKRNKLWLFYIAISLLLSGLSIIGISFIINDVLTLAFSQYNLSFIISSIESSLSRQILLSGIIVLLTSLIIYIIYNKTKSKSII